MKYIIKKTGEELKIGDIIDIAKSHKFSFGKLVIKETVTVDSDVLKELLDRGIVVATSSKDLKDISFYIERLAQKMGIKSEEVIKMLENINIVCPKAVLDILLNVISDVFYSEDPKAFDGAEHYYSIRLADGKCGEVHKIHSYIPLFKSKEDVEAAREILKEQLIYMYGEQEGN